MLSALLSVGSNLLSGYLGSKASSKATKAQLTAAREANALQRDMYDQQREDLAPWRQAGTSALGQLQALLSNPQSVTQNPGYQFRYDQGMNALQNSAANRGGLYSGRAMKDAMRFGQGIASDELTNSYNRLANLAGLGQTGSTQSAAAAGMYGNSVGNTLQNMGNVRAAGTMGAANSWQNALAQMLNDYQERDLMQQYSQAGQPYYGFPGDPNDPNAGW